MKDANIHFVEVIKDRLKLLNSNAYAIETQASLPADAIRNVLRGQGCSGPTLSRVSEICDALGLEFYFGPKRIPEKTALDVFAEKAAQFTYAVDGSPEALKEGFLPIPYNKHDPKHKDDGVAPVAFSRTWMIDRGFDPDNLSMIEVPNNRMAPTIRKGALALIVKGPDDNDNLVWAFLANGKLDVARLCFMGDSRIVIRDHPDELPIFAQTASIAPLGRIIWVAASF